LATVAMVLLLVFFKPPTERPQEAGASIPVTEKPVTLHEQDSQSPYVS